MPPNNLERRLDQTEDRLDIVERDMWRGNGLPGITTRLKMLEEDVSDLKLFLKESAQKRETKLNLILAGIVSLAVALIAYAVTGHH